MKALCWKTGISVFFFFVFFSPASWGFQTTLDCGIAKATVEGKLRPDGVFKEVYLTVHRGEDWTRLRYTEVYFGAVCDVGPPVDEFWAYNDSGQLIRIYIHSVWFKAECASKRCLQKKYTGIIPFDELRVHYRRRPVFDQFAKTYAPPHIPRFTKKTPAWILPSAQTLKYRIPLPPSPPLVQKALDKTASCGGTQVQMEGWLNEIDLDPGIVFFNFYSITVRRNEKTIRLLFDTGVLYFVCQKNTQGKPYIIYRAAAYGGTFDGEWGVIDAQTLLLITPSEQYESLGYEATVALEHQLGLDLWLFGTERITPGWEPPPEP